MQTEPIIEENTGKWKEYQDTLFTFFLFFQKKLSIPFLRAVQKKYGWTTLQYNAFCILNYEKRMTMSEISDLLGITRQQTTQLINSLVEKGWVEREYEPSDRRNIYVKLTEYATECLIESGENLSSNLYRSLSSMPEEESEKVLESLDAISRWLETVKRADSDIL